jgi:putative transposase
MKRGKFTSTSQRKDKLLLVKSYMQQHNIKLIDACDLAGVHLRTYQRWIKIKDNIDKRILASHSPTNKLTQRERERILEVCNISAYASLPPSQIVPKLADEGIYLASESTFYRILKSANQLQHRLSAKPSIKKHKPKECIATQPNQVYTWDITYLSTNIKGIFFYLYMIVDIYSRKVVGFQVHDSENSQCASELLTHVCKQENIIPNQIILHSDNGSPMKGATMQYTMQQLGVISSYSRPSVSNDNPYSEALFRTVKHCPSYSGNFNSLQDSREWTAKFVRWYNYEHKHSSISFVSPDERHRGLDNKLLQQRRVVYEKARNANPKRWIKGVTRSWKYCKKVSLNPDGGSHQKAA